METDEHGEVMLDAVWPRAMHMHEEVGTQLTDAGARHMMEVGAKERSTTECSDEWIGEESVSCSRIEWTIEQVHGRLTWVAATTGRRGYDSTTMTRIIEM